VPANVKGKIKVVAELDGWPFAVKGNATERELGAPKPAADR
jgi:hypothetical protein